VATELGRLRHFKGFSLFLPSMYLARNIMLFCNVYNINGRISAMTRLDLEVCVMDLQHEADRLLEGSMALNTLNSYRTGLASYENF
jgi:hypothetical protein